MNPNKERATLTGLTQSKSMSLWKDEVRKFMKKAVGLKGWLTPLTQNCDNLQTCGLYCFLVTAHGGSSGSGLPPMWLTVCKRPAHSLELIFGGEVMQGDPLSPLLFNLTLHRALSAILQEVGVGIGGTNYQYLAFSDNVVLLAILEAGLRASLPRQSA